MGGWDKVHFIFLKTKVQRKGSISKPTFVMVEKFLGKNGDFHTRIMIHVSWTIHHIHGAASRQIPTHADMAPHKGAISSRNIHVQRTALLSRMIPLIFLLSLFRRLERFSLLICTHLSLIILLIHFGRVQIFLQKYCSRMSIKNIKLIYSS